MVNLKKLKLWTRPSYIKLRIEFIKDDLFQMFSDECFYCDGKLHIMDWENKGRWKYRLLSLIFTENYWLRSQYEDCPWQEQIEEYGEPYHSRF